MSNVNFRKRSVYIAIAILIAAFGINIWFSGMKKLPDKAPEKNTAIPVKALAVTNDSVNANIWMSGRLRATQKVELFTEVTGKLKIGNKPFKDGTSFRKGEVLLQLDATDYRMNLNATRSGFQSTVSGVLADIKIDYPALFPKWQKFVSSISPTATLPELPETDDAQFNSFLAARNVLNQYFSIRAQEAQLSKYTIIAPFDGVLANANLNPNTVVRNGQSIGEFLNPTHYELEAGISLDHAQKIDAGQAVKLTSSDIDGHWIGRIVRVGKSVDATTQTVKVYITVSGASLFEGMYLSGTIAGSQLEKAISIPRHLLVDDHFVYVVNQNKLAKVNVQVLHQNRDQVVVAGLQDGEMMIQQMIPGATEGMPVTIVK